MVPNGETPECVKNHPALKGVALPQTGGIERAGLIVTKTLLLAGEGGGVRSPSGPLSGGPMFRAYDKKTGENVWQAALPAGPQTGLPMTYMYQGNQYIVLATRGPQNSGAQLVAWTVAPTAAPAAPPQ